MSHLHFADEGKYDQLLDVVRGAHGSAGGDALVWYGEPGQKPESPDRGDGYHPEAQFAE